MEYDGDNVQWIYPAKHGSEFEYGRDRDCLSTKTTLGKRSFRAVDVEQLHCNAKSATKENSVIAERMRRSRMKDLCSKLESLLPSTLPKLDRCGLYEEASNYIGRLEGDLSQLKSQRDSLLAQQSAKAAKESMEAVKVSVEIHGSEVVIGMSSMRKPRCLWRIMQELEQHHVDVNMSQLSTTDFFVSMNIYARFTEDAQVHDPLHLRSSLQTRLQVVY